MAGGVALNCSANGKLTRSGLFDEVYVQPAAGDDGAALGAALHRASLRGEVINRRFPVPFLGPSHPHGRNRQRARGVLLAQSRLLGWKASKRPVSGPRR